MRCWRAGQHELLELAVRGEQHLGGGRLEGDASLGADDGIAQMDAAADAEGRGERLERLDERRPARARWPSSATGRPLLEADDVPLGRARAG